MICLISPNISFSNNQSPDIPDNAIINQQPANPSSNLTHQKKEVLAGDRELDTFFIIGLIINFIMMTTFAVWAIGQWRQNNKENKTSNNSSRKTL